MIQILTGFAVIALAVFVGWIAGRTGVLGPGARPVLAKLNFNVLAPFLLFSVLATADVGALFSALLPVSALAALAVMLALRARVARRLAARARAHPDRLARLGIRQRQQLRHPDRGVHAR